MAATLAATPVRIPAIQMGQVGGALATSAAGSRAGGGGMSVGDINVSLSGTPINSMLDTRVVGREVAKTVMSELRYQQRRGG
jgi:hypothetical protein